MRKIPLAEGIFSIVDDDDFDFLSRLGLSIRHKSLIVRFENKKRCFTIPATFLLLKPPGRMYPIHRNGNFLDLRKSNLQLVDMSQLNHSVRLNYKNTQKTSRYRGVSFKRQGVTWLAQIMYHGIRYRKRFPTEIESAIWYNEKARELFGELAFQNIIDSEGGAIEMLECD